MSEIRVSVFEESREGDELWNRFVDDSNEGTIFHRLDFLRYHRAKFRPYEHHLVWRKGEEILGVMPMAVLPEDGRLIARSPYGASYGGPVFARPITYRESHEIVESMLGEVSNLPAQALSLTLPIPCCYEQYSDTFRLVLMESGFECTSRDISSVVPLATGADMAERVRGRVRRFVRKAEAAGVETMHRGDLGPFWSVLTKTLQRYEAMPTHTVEEYDWLSRQFPDRVFVDVAYLDGTPVAGVGFFAVNQRVMTSFYLCQDPEHSQLQALTLLVSTGMHRAARGGFRWFDLGTSSSLTKGRPNLFRFKEGFGAIGLFRETYVWGDRLAALASRESH